MSSYKMNRETYDTLLSILGFLSDGRITLARERLEELLGLNTQDAA